MEEEGGELSPCPLDRPCAVEEKGIAFPRPSFRQFPPLPSPSISNPLFSWSFRPSLPPPSDRVLDPSPPVAVRLQLLYTFPRGERRRKYSLKRNLSKRLWFGLVQ